MRAALLLFPVINHQSGKQILQIHPYIHFLYTRIFLEGFLYWYEGVNPHITSVTVK